MACGILIGFRCEDSHIQLVGDVGLRKSRSNTARNRRIRKGVGMVSLIASVYALNSNHIGALWYICLQNGGRLSGLNDWFIRLVRHRGLYTGIAAGRSRLQQSLKPEQLVMADIRVTAWIRSS